MFRVLTENEKYKILEDSQAVIEIQFKGARPVEKIQINTESSFSLGFWSKMRNGCRVMTSLYKSFIKTSIKDKDNKEIFSWQKELP